MERDDYKPMIYHINVITNEYPRHPLDMDIMIQISTFDGRVMQRRVTENLEKYIGMNDAEILKFLSLAISCRMIEDLQEDIKSNIAEMIYDKIGKK